MLKNKILCAKCLLYILEVILWKEDKAHYRRGKEVWERNTIK